MFADQYFGADFNMFIIIALFIKDAAVSLQSSPGLMRHHNGDDVTFSWTFTDKLENILGIEISYNIDVVVVKRLSNGHLTIDDKYKDRVTFNVLDKSIKLILNDVSDDDVINGVYSLEVRYVIGGKLLSIRDNKAEIYLFGK